MDNLQGNLQIFKAKRRAAEQIMLPVDELEGLVKMYEAINVGTVGLKQEFSERWDKLPTEKRSQLVNRLLELELLPKEIGRALEIFGGEVLSLI